MGRKACRAEAKRLTVNTKWTQSMEGLSKCVSQWLGMCSEAPSREQPVGPEQHSAQSRSKEGMGQHM